MNNERLYCIICGSKSKGGMNLCSAKCSIVYFDFILNNNQSSMKGFCNRCGMPLELKKNRNGIIQEKHDACQSRCDYYSKMSNEQRTSVEVEIEKRVHSSENIYGAGGILSHNMQPHNSVQQKHEPFSEVQGIRNEPILSKMIIAVKNKSYYHILKESIEGCQDYDSILKYLPVFYLLISDIGCDPKANWYTKMLVNAALSYLVLEEDVIPDTVGPKGYLDDLYICAYVLKEIRDRVSKTIILENANKLGYGDEIFQLIYDAVNETSSYLEDKTEDILSVVSLNKFTLFDLLYDQEKSKKLKNRKEKRRLLYAMLAIKVKSILDQDNTDIQIMELKSLIKDHHEFDEIKTYMGFIDENE